MPIGSRQRKASKIALLPNGPTLLAPSFDRDQCQTVQYHVPVGHQLEYSNAVFACSPWDAMTRDQTSIPCEILSGISPIFGTRWHYQTTHETPVFF